MNKNLLLSILVIVAVIGLGAWAINKTPASVESPQVTQNDDVGGLAGGTIPAQEDLGTSLGSPVTMHAGESVTFSDGLKVLLKEINDSRCKSGVQCIWQGEISGTFAISGGKVSGTKEIFLGTERNKSVVLNDYTFTLNNATPTEITFTPSYKKTASGGPCYVGGCSAQICSDQKDTMSTCEFRQEYACYKTAKCERQSSGECGWTTTPALQACLAAS
jgi:hypothetical protein